MVLLAGGDLADPRPTQLTQTRTYTRLRRLCAKHMWLIFDTARGEAVLLMGDWVRIKVRHVRNTRNGQHNFSLFDIVNPPFFKVDFPFQHQTTRT